MSAAEAVDEKKVVGKQKVIGLLGGVAWASSAEYYRFLK